MEIIKLKISDITPYQNNAKIHTKEQIEQIKNSIKEFGNNDPIAVWGDKNIIVEGHGRYDALKELGYEEVPCIRLDHLTEEQRKAYTLAHNKLTMNTEFDYSKLDEELEDILDIDMSMFDFNIIEDEYDTDFELKDGDREPIQTLSITLSDEQVEVVNEAISKMKNTELYKNYENINKNSNGNALYLVVLEWLQLKK